MLQADPYALRYAASRFSAGAKEFRSQASRFLARKTELVSHGWQGIASQSFDTQIELQIAYLNKNSDVLEQIASVLNQLASRMERVLELRRQAEQCEMAIWEYSGDSMDDLHHAQNLRRQATHYRNQAEWEAQQADSTASGQLQHLMSMIPNGMNLVGQGRGSIDDLDGLPESIKSYYKRHPELVEDESASEVANTISWASVKRADETVIQQDADTRSHLLALLKNLTKQERMGYWDQSLDQEVFDQDYGDMSTDELKAQVFARLLKQQSSNNEDEIAAINASISSGVDFIPVVGNLKSAVEAITGKDYITSHELSWFERGLALAGVFVGGVAKVRKAEQTVEAVYDANKAAQTAQKYSAGTIRNVGNDILDISEGAGGHLLEKHVAQRNEDLIKRANQEGVDATSYNDKSTALKATQENIRQNADKIANWLNDPTMKGTKAFEATHSNVIGKGVESRGVGGQAGGKQVTSELNDSRIVLVKDPAMKEGYRILTGFPIFK